jgi:hypothetical protein
VLVWGLLVLVLGRMKGKLPRGRFVKGNLQATTVIGVFKFCIAYGVTSVHDTQVGNNQVA